MRSLPDTYEGERPGIGSGALSLNADARLVNATGTPDERNDGKSNSEESHSEINSLKETNETDVFIGNRSEEETDDDVNNISTRSCLTIRHKRKTTHDDDSSASSEPLDYSLPRPQSDPLDLSGGRLQTASQSGLQCNICSRKFRKKKLYDMHIENHNEMKFKCPDVKCPQLFMNLNILRNHYEYVHHKKLTKALAEEATIKGHHAKRLTTQGPNEIISKGDTGKACVGNGTKSDSSNTNCEIIILSDDSDEDNDAVTTKQQNKKQQDQTLDPLCGDFPQVMADFATDNESTLALDSGNVIFTEQDFRSMESLLVKELTSSTTQGNGFQATVGVQEGIRFQQGGPLMHNEWDPVQILPVSNTLSDSAEDIKPSKRIKFCYEEQTDAPGDKEIRHNEFTQNQTQIDRCVEDPEDEFELFCKHTVALVLGVLPRRINSLTKCNILAVLHNIEFGTSCPSLSDDTKDDSVHNEDYSTQSDDYNFCKSSIIPALRRMRSQGKANKAKLEIISIISQARNKKS